MGISRHQTKKTIITPHTMNNFEAQTHSIFKKKKSLSISSPSSNPSFEKTNLTNLFCPDLEYNPLLPNDCTKILRASEDLLCVAYEKRPLMCKKIGERCVNRKTDTELRTSSVSSPILGGNRGGLKAAHKIMQKFGWKP